MFYGCGEADGDDQLACSAFCVTDANAELEIRSAAPTELETQDNMFLPPALSANVSVRVEVRSRDVRDRLATIERALESDQKFAYSLLRDLDGWFKLRIAAAELHATRSRLERERRACLDRFDAADVASALAPSVADLLHDLSPRTAADAEPELVTLRDAHRTLDVRADGAIDRGELAAALARGGVARKDFVAALANEVDAQAASSDELDGTVLSPERAVRRRQERAVRRT